jgi:hypothetical protein
LGVYVTFMVTSEDTNRDGQLNDLDEREVIVCDQDGRNPRVVTPQGTQCWDLRYDGRGTIYMLLVSDTDGDGRFTDADESTPYFYNAKTTPNGAQPVISAGIAQRADALLTSGERRTGNRVTPIR